MGDESIEEYSSWGSDIDPSARLQMSHALSLPVSVAGALLPDAHVGYGLPIGGVLATEKAVIPYAVGVDIACRVVLSIFEEPASHLFERQEEISKALERETFFGMGVSNPRPQQHGVMDESWGISPFVQGLKDLAAKQLGTSGSGNHFVEFGEFEFRGKGANGLSHLALVSHSGSRGPGARVADFYQKLAQRTRSDLPSHLHHLAWLDLPGDGEEYWAAMELMGRYASANHHIIHETLRQTLKLTMFTQIENHHNFAWRESIRDKELIVHRKGATPAGNGVLGYIPGTMIAPGFLVEGKGNAESLQSSSHGAGRRMSRTQARKAFSRDRMLRLLSSHGVTLIGGGLDESPEAYKDINEVMEAQRDLVSVRGVFTPKIVRMAPEGEKAED